MPTRVRARYVDGVLTPLEPLQLDDGCLVTIDVTESEPPLRGLAAIVDRAERLHRTMPAEAWDDLPTDLAQNKKHYLYGHPREEGE